MAVFRFVLLLSSVKPHQCGLRTLRRVYGWPVRIMLVRCARERPGGWQSEIEKLWSGRAKGVTFSKSATLQKAPNGWTMRKRGKKVFWGRSST